MLEPDLRISRDCTELPSSVPWSAVCSPPLLRTLSLSTAPLVRPSALFALLAAGGQVLLFVFLRRHKAQEAKIFCNSCPGEGTRPSLRNLDTLENSLVIRISLHWLCWGVLGINSVQVSSCSRYPADQQAPQVQNSRKSICVCHQPFQST